MASGYGLNGGTYPKLVVASQILVELVAFNWIPTLIITLPAGPSRCFPFWQEVLACYVVNTNSEDDSGKKKCVPILEDYYECLHHKKEVRGLFELSYQKQIYRFIPPDIPHRQTGYARYKQHIERQKQRIQEIMHQRPAR
jgi:hypothetical protein